MDFTKALTYPFDDEDWLKKLGIAAGLGLAVVLLGGFLIGLIAIIPLIGWSLETIKRVRANEPNPLASWDDFGAMFSSGLTPFLAGIVYQIPTLIIYCLSMGVIVLPMLGGGDSDLTAILGTAGVFLFYCCLCLIILYSMVVGIVLWAGLIRYLDKPEFGTFMEIGENISLVRNNMGDFGMAFLFVLLGGVVVSIVGMIPCVGWIVSMPFQFYYSSHILGQLAQKVSGAGVPAAAGPQV